jgi:tRNA G18 (ribose-2'-O)-methylase SpoU
LLGSIERDIYHSFCTRVADGTPTQEEETVVAQCLTRQLLLSLLAHSGWNIVGTAMEADACPSHKLGLSAPTILVLGMHSLGPS